MRQKQQDDGDMSGGLFRFFTYLLCSPGVILSFSLTKTGEVGWRALMNPATAAGFLTSITLIGLSVPPLFVVLVAALVWMAVVRHRIWPAPGQHSRSIGDCYVPLLPSNAGRALAGMAAVTIGLVMAQYPGPYLGLAYWLVIAGVGQWVLHALFERKRQLMDADALDALYEAKERAGRLGR